MGTARRLLLVTAVAMLPAGHAAAQTLPWPTDAPRAGAPAPWPGEPAAPSPAMSPAMGAPRPMMGGGGGPPPCMTEFTRLREEVEKKGKAAKAASQRKVAREQMCKFITSYSASEAKWVKYSESNAQTCGIPSQIVNQLKHIHANTERTRQQVCAAGPATGGPPSLSEALGTSRLPTPESVKAGYGTLDTLTGSAIAR